MIAQPKLDTILSAIGRRIMTGEAVTALEAIKQHQPEEEGQPFQGLAMISVHGSLVAKHSHLAAASNLCSYDYIDAQLDAALADDGVKAIALDLDSPGGEASKVFDLADKIRAARDLKPIWALVNDAALSAAYALASAASKIIVTRTSQLGSIGVVAAHLDQSEADAKAGLSYRFITSGEKKADGNPHEPLSNRAEADLQAEVSRLYELFVGTVAQNRGLSEAAVRNTQAGVFAGPAAVNVGLADAVMPTQAALTALIDLNHLKPSGILMSNNTAQDLSPAPIPAQAGSPPPQDPAQIQAKPQSEPAQQRDIIYLPPPDQALSAAAQGQRSQEQAAQARDAALRAEFAEISDIAAQASRLGVKVDVSEALKSSQSPSVLRKAVLDQLSQNAEAQPLVAAAPAPSNFGITDTAAPQASGLIAAAKREAARITGGAAHA